MDFGQKGNIILYFSQIVHVFVNDDHQQRDKERCKLGQRKQNRFIDGSQTNVDKRWPIHTDEWKHLHRVVGKLNSLWWFGFRLEPIFMIAPAASKNDAWFKKGQDWLEHKKLALLI